MVTLGIAIPNRVQAAPVAMIARTLKSVSQKTIHSVESAFRILLGTVLPIPTALVLVKCVMIASSHVNAVLETHAILPARPMLIAVLAILARFQMGTVEQQRARLTRIASTTLLAQQRVLAARVPLRPTALWTVVSVSRADAMKHLVSVPFHLPRERESERARPDGAVLSCERTLLIVPDSKSIPTYYNMSKRYVVAGWYMIGSHDS